MFGMSLHHKSRGTQPAADSSPSRSSGRSADAAVWPGGSRGAAGSKHAMGNAWGMTTSWWAAMPSSRTVAARKRCKRFDPGKGAEPIIVRVCAPSADLQWTHASDHDRLPPFGPSEATSVRSKSKSVATAIFLRLNWRAKSRRLSFALATIRTFSERNALISGSFVEQKFLDAARQPVLHRNEPWLMARPSLANCVLRRRPRLRYWPSETARTGCRELCPVFLISFHATGDGCYARPLRNCLPLVASLEPATGAVISADHWRVVGMNESIVRWAMNGKPAGWGVYRTLQKLLCQLATDRHTPRR